MSSTHMSKQSERFGKPGDTVSLTSKALSRLGDVKNPDQKKAGPELSTIKESDGQVLRPRLTNFDKIKPTETNDQKSNAEERLKGMGQVSINEFYEFKLDHIDDTKSNQDKELFQRRKQNIIKMMRENRPVFDQYAGLMTFMAHALGQVDYHDFEEIRDGLE